MMNTADNASQAGEAKKPSKAKIVWIVIGVIVGLRILGSCESTGRQSNRDSRYDRLLSDTVDNHLSNIVLRN